MSTMVRTQIYLPVKLKQRLQAEARVRELSFSEILREQLEEYLKDRKTSRINGAQILLEGARWAEEYAKKENIHAPKDLSVNHDKYLYGSEMID